MKNLLIVEDDKNTLAGLRELLCDEGYNVFGTNNGLEALSLAAKTQVDIVLCDYCLPEMNGLQVCRELKKIQPDSQLFMYTALRDEETFQNAYDSGVAKIFTKPIIVSELFESFCKC